GGYPLQAMTPKQALDGSHADHIIGRPTTPYLLQGLSYGVVGKDHPMIRMGAVKCLRQEESHHTANSRRSFDVKSVALGKKRRGAGFGYHSLIILPTVLTQEPIFRA
ncbi:MAG: hypothetical protein IJ083_01490, partial [Clostridia bacterium]|nr:hypothetical protein [Clostridia bacterium]